MEVSEYQFVYEIMFHEIFFLLFCTMSNTMEEGWGFMFEESFESVGVLSVDEVSGTLMVP